MQSFPPNWIANNAVRAAVEQLHLTPKQVRPKMKDVADIDVDQRVILSEVDEAIAIQQRLRLREDDPRPGYGPGTPQWQDGLRVRAILQKAILAGFGGLEPVASLAILYGAMPDPRWDNKYFRLANGCYWCWRCGAAVLAATFTSPIWTGPGPACGWGEVESVKVPYCPRCDPDPDPSRRKRQKGRSRSKR